VVRLVRYRQGQPDADLAVTVDLDVPGVGVSRSCGTQMRTSGAPTKAPARRDPVRLGASGSADGDTSLEVAGTGLHTGRDDVVEAADQRRSAFDQIGVCRGDEPAQGHPGQGADLE
jgi:hypothetical protein